MSFETPTVVRLSNEGDKPFRDTYGNTPYTVLPGKEIIVPWEAAVLWLGNPTFVDDEARALFPRNDELQRLLVRLGAHVNSEAPPLTDDERLLAAAPKVKVRSVDGDDITMLTEDPLGESALPARFTRGDKDDLRGELDRLKEEQSRLLQMLEQQANEKTSPGLDSVEADTPNRVGVAPNPGV